MFVAPPAQYPTPTFPAGTVTGEGNVNVFQPAAAPALIVISDETPRSVVGMLFASIVTRFVTIGMFGSGG